MLQQMKFTSIHKSGNYVNVAWETEQYIPVMLYKHVSGIQKNCDQMP